MGSATQRRRLGAASAEADLAIRALPFVLSLIAGSTDVIGFLGRAWRDQRRDRGSARCRSCRKCRGGARAAARMTFRNPHCMQLNEIHCRRCYRSVAAADVALSRWHSETASWNLSHVGGSFDIVDASPLWE
jgi:hypothetical protein